MDVLGTWDHRDAPTTHHDGDPKPSHTPLSHPSNLPHRAPFSPKLPVRTFFPIQSFAITNVNEPARSQGTTAIGFVARG